MNSLFFTRPQNWGGPPHKNFGFLEFFEGRLEPSKNRRYFGTFFHQYTSSAVAAKEELLNIQASVMNVSQLSYIRKSAYFFQHLSTSFVEHSVFYF